MDQACFISGKLLSGKKGALVHCNVKEDPLKRVGREHASTYLRPRAAAPPDPPIAPGNWHYPGGRAFPE